MGLVEMTRKRVRPSLAQSLSEPCSRCGGSGRVLSPLSTSINLERSLERISAGKTHRNVVVSVHPELAAYLLVEEGRRLEYLSGRARLNLEIHEDQRLRVDEFRIFSLDTHQEMDGDRVEEAEG
jgi:Ribonuclease G/E